MYFNKGTTKPNIKAKLQCIMQIKESWHMCPTETLYLQEVGKHFVLSLTWLCIEIMISLFVFLLCVFLTAHLKLHTVKFLLILSTHVGSIDTSCDSLKWKVKQWDPKQWHFWWPMRRPSVFYSAYVNKTTRCQNDNNLISHNLLNIS